MNPSVQTRLRSEDDPRRGFGSHREFLLSVMQNARWGDRSQVRDERLRPLVFSEGAGDLAFVLPRAFHPGSIRAAAGSDEQGKYSNPHGGFLGNREAWLTLGHTTFEGDPTAGRTQFIPMTEPIVKITARTDKDHNTSVTGGLKVTRHPETVAPEVTRAAMDQVILEATDLTGIAYATEQLLSASPAGFASIVSDGFRVEYAATMLREKIRGLGGGEYIGVLNSSAKITVDKETGQAAATINASNAFKMASRLWGAGIWLANPDCRAQIYGLSLPIGTGGAALYQPPAFEGAPGMLCDSPLFWTEFCSTLGTEGDLILCNWSQYLEGLRSTQYDESVHVRYTSLERAFRFWVRNAGAPWWNAPLTPFEGAATLSPIVTLQTRA